MTSTRVVPLHDLLADLPDALVLGDANPDITDVVYDSREVTKGALFAALPGADFDGHAFIERAIAAGAAAVLCEHPAGATVPQIVVPDSRAALAVIATAFHGHPSRELRTIGITGTDGKTTTSFLLEHILTYAGQRAGVIGTVGIRVGNGITHDLGHQTTPESNRIQGFLREMVTNDVDTAVVEATSHGLAMHRLDGVTWDIAGVTNITHEHLEYHKTIENYRRAKAILIERTAVNRGVVVLNANDEGARAMAAWATDAIVRWYSMDGAAADITATRVVAHNTSTSFALTIDDETFPIELPMIGGFNVANALLAAGLAQAAGVAPQTIAAALHEPVDVPGRMRILDEGQDFDVVVDYAHTPESLRKILTLLRSLHPETRLIVVSGSAGERDATKRPLQGAVCAELADVAIFTSEDPRNEDPDRIIADIAAGARETGAVAGQDFHQITDRTEAIAKAFALAQPGDCVLLAGKGHETSIIWGYEHRPWNEAEVAKALLHKRATSMQEVRAS